MKIVVTGSRGMLAQDLLARLERGGFAVIGLDLPELDITRSQEVFAQLNTIRPALVINCAAYTAVDKAESEPAVTFAVNRDGSANLAEPCRCLDIPLLHLSTDYVFDGKAKRPYREDDPTNPLGVYGQSKLEGEEAIRTRLAEHLIVRTSWLYGMHGQNFVKTILRLAKERKKLRVVSDQYGCPTWTGDLAEALVAMAGQIHENRKSIQWGTYHFCGAGTTTWYEFAKAIVEEARVREKLRTSRVVAISTSDYPTAAQRPRCSVLDCSKIREVFHISATAWKEGLEGVLDELYKSHTLT